MAVPDHTIGGLSVLILADSESVKARQQQIAVVRRPGITGFTVRALGVQGVPFRTRVFRDCTDATDARNQEVALAGMVGLVKALKGPDGFTDNVFVHAAKVERFAIFSATSFIKTSPTWAVECELILELVA